MKKLFLIALTPLLLACGKDDEAKDVTAPVVENFIIPDVHPGDTLRASVRVTDNESLSSAKFEIHADTDNHTHRTTENYFSYSKTIALSGKVQIVDLVIPVGSDAAIAVYHFTVRALDASGNESPLKAVEFYVAPEGHVH
jgi:hypothetical protein